MEMRFALSNIYLVEGSNVIRYASFSLAASSSGWALGVM